MKNLFNKLTSLPICALFCVLLLMYFIFLEILFGGEGNTYPPWATISFLVFIAITLFLVVSGLFKSFKDNFND